MSISKLFSRGRVGTAGTVSLPEGVLTYAAPTLVVGGKHVGASRYKGLTYGPLVVLEAGEPGRTAAAEAAEARVARELSPLISASIERSIQALNEADAFVQHSNQKVDHLLARLRASVV